MTEKQKKKTGRGGYRPDAGRKPNKTPTQRVGIRLTAAEHEKLMALGGSAWIRAQLKRVENEKD